MRMWSSVLGSVLSWAIADSSTMVGRLVEDRKVVCLGVENAITRARKPTVQIRSHVVDSCSDPKLKLWQWVPGCFGSRVVGVLLDDESLCVCGT